MIAEVMVRLMARGSGEEIMVVVTTTMLMSRMKKPVSPLGGLARDDKCGVGIVGRRGTG
jgi:hypothetical protein